MTRSCPSKTSALWMNCYRMFYPRKSFSRNRWGPYVPNTDISLTLAQLEDAQRALLAIQNGSADHARAVQEQAVLFEQQQDDLDNG